MGGGSHAQKDRRTHRERGGVAEAEGRGAKVGGRTANPSLSFLFPCLAFHPRCCSPFPALPRLSLPLSMSLLLSYSSSPSLEQFVDNEQSVLVSDAKPEEDLPDSLKTVLQVR
jgi:hypothetical protein